MRSCIRAFDMLRSCFRKLRGATRSEMQRRDDLLIRVFRFVPAFVRPNHITAVRIVVAALLFLPGLIGAGTATALLLFGALGDLADGVLARKRGQVTLSGKFFDPIADKLLVVGVLYHLYARGIVGAGVVVAVIAPEALYLFYAAGYAITRRTAVPDPSLVGKAKVACYYAGFAVLLIAYMAGSGTWHEIGTVVLIIGIVLAWIAHVFYAYDAVRGVIGGASCAGRR